MRLHWRYQLTALWHLLVYRIIVFAIASLGLALLLAVLHALFLAINPFMDYTESTDYTPLQVLYYVFILSLPIFLAYQFIIWPPVFLGLYRMNDNREGLAMGSIEVKGEPEMLRSAVNKAFRLFHCRGKWIKLPESGKYIFRMRNSGAHWWVKMYVLMNLSTEGSPRLVYVRLPVWRKIGKRVTNRGTVPLPGRDDVGWSAMNYVFKNS